MQIILSKIIHLSKNKSDFDFNFKTNTNELTSKLNQTFFFYCYKIKKTKRRCKKVKLLIFEKSKN